MTGAPTAGEVVRRIIADRAAAGYEWFEPTVDTLKAGSFEAPVTGVASSWMATSAVIAEAAERGCSMLVTHEPTFWNHLDLDPAPATARELAAKRDLIERTGMTIWRFHDHNHMSFPRDPVFDALLSQLGWLDTTTGDSLGAVSHIGATTLRDVAERVGAALGTRNVRIVGDPAQPVSSVGFAGHTLDGCLAAAKHADAVIVGEVREWDTFEYFRDARALGVPKGLLALSHRQLETWGADAVAAWLAPLVPEVPVIPVVAVEPFAVIEP